MCVCVTLQFYFFLSIQQTHSTLKFCNKKKKTAFLRDNDENKENVMKKIKSEYLQQTTIECSECTTHDE
jgi:hypothetical protein